MKRIYEILVRVWPDGRIGAHVQFYQEDGVTPRPDVSPIHTDDFPAETKQTLASLIDNVALEAVKTNTLLQAQLTETQTALADTQEQLGKVPGLVKKAVGIS